MNSPVELETAQTPSFWSSVKEALRGSHQNYTEGPIGRSIVLLAVPMVMEMFMESVFAVVDVFFVAKLGADAVATVGLTESLLTIIYTLAMGLSIGASALVARRIGEGNRDAASVTAVQALIMGAALSIVIGLAGALFAPQLLKAMGGSDELIAKGVNYTRILLGGNVVIIALFLINAIFRGAGDGALAMRALWIANWTNIILAPCLIFGWGPFPAMGVMGAATATTFGRGVGALYAGWNLLSAKGRVSVERRHLKIQGSVMATMLRLSSSATVQSFIGMASWIGLIRIVSSFGSESLAGYTIAIRVILFALFPAFGMSSAAATMVGQALGAHKPDRAESAVWKTGFYNMLFLGSIGLIFVIFTRPIISIFTPDPAIQVYAVAGLRTVAYGFLFYAYGMVITQSFNGAGDTWTPTLLNLIVFWFFEIPLAYVLAKPMGYGPFGVFLSITAAFSILALASAVLFRRGRWKLKVV